MGSAFRSGLVVAAVFLVVAISLSGLLPLWLDEIIQLRETRNTTPSQLIASLPGQPGAAPLGYLTQQAALRTTGYSARRARLPSAIFASGAVLIVAVLGAECGLTHPWIAAAIFGIFPATLRYGAESRVYSEALFFSVLATFLFMRILKNPTVLLSAGYCLSLMAAVYTQPYAIFVGIAHILYIAFKHDLRARLTVTAAFAVAVLAFLPWYFWTKANWTSGIAGAGLHFTLSAKTPLMLFRELAGAGYWGSGLLLVLCAIAVRGRSQFSTLLLLLIGVPVVLALLIDGKFQYFVASRQILWVLPAVAVLGVQAVERNYRIAVPIALLLAAICAWQSFRFFTAPRENWQIAADALAGEVASGACMIVVPREQAYSYEFFRPQLADSYCPAPRTVVAFTPYATNEQRQKAVSSLNSEGYARQSGYDAGKSEIALFSR
jgi:4-amino-4-deoxy-L-arabinose transferase-like glycosyltransferase